MVIDAIKSILSDTTNIVDSIDSKRRAGSRWVIYTMISDVPVHDKDGAASYDSYRFQIDIYAMDYSHMDSLAGEVRTALDNYSGTVESVEIDQIYFDGQFDTIEEIEEEKKYHRRIQEYIIKVRT